MNSPPRILTVRRARQDEAEALSVLAFRSKAHWGYDAAFLEACRNDLTISPATLENGPYLVAEEDGRLLGFANLSEGEQGARLENLFVAPEAMGRGVGRLLWEHLLREARARGHSFLLIDSDPHAEGFYRRLGAERIGVVPSTVFPDRELPLLRFSLDREAGGAIMPL